MFRTILKPFKFQKKVWVADWRSPQVRRWSWLALSPWGEAHRPIKMPSEQKNGCRFLCFSPGCCLVFQSGAPSLLFLSPCQFTPETWVSQFYREPRVFTLEMPKNGYLWNWSPEPASNPSTSSSPTTLQNWDTQVIWKTVLAPNRPLLYKIGTNQHGLIMVVF